MRTDTIRDQCCPATPGIYVVWSFNLAAAQMGLSNYMHSPSAPSLHCSPSAGICPAAGIYFLPGASSCVVRTAPVLFRKGDQLCYSYSRAWN